MFGVSMGGMIAQELVLRYPDRVDRLVLGCTHSGGAGFTMPSSEDILAIAPDRGASPHEIARQNITILFGPKFQKENPDLVEAMIQRYMENPPPRRPFALQFMAALGHDCYDRLEGIRQPTLIITGDADVLIPRGNAETLRARIPGSRLIRIPDLGHVFFIEDPKETARILKEHLLGDGLARMLHETS
jgi:pimeloyl-ACP methyl ester carboxylesterase